MGRGIRDRSMPEDRKQIDKFKATKDGVEAEGSGVGLLADVISRSKNLTRPVGDILGMLGLDWIRRKRLDAYIRRNDANPDIVAAVLSDPDIQRELSNIELVAAKASAYKKARQDEQFNAPNLKVRDELIDAISVESDSELQEIWAQLLDAATTPGNAGPTIAQISTLKQFEPEDAAVFRYLYFEVFDQVRATGAPAIHFGRFASALEKDRGIVEPEAVIERLARQRCVRIASGIEVLQPDPFNTFSGRDTAVSLASVKAALNQIAEFAQRRVLFSTAFGSGLAANLSPHPSAADKIDKK